VGTVTVGVTVMAEGLMVVAEEVAMVGTKEVAVVGKMGSMVRELVSVETGAVAVPDAESDGETPELVAVPVGWAEADDDEEEDEGPE